MSQALATTSPEPVTDIEIQRENAAFEMIQRQAKMFSVSSLVPKEFQGNLANCAIGINIAKRLGADPFMVLQNIDIIHGRPSFRATFLIAMVNASGRFKPLQFRVAGEGMERNCIAWTHTKDGNELLEGPPVSMAMAKSEGWSTKNGSKWQTMPELMLRYRAAAFFARLYAPDITLGMMTAEEAVEIVPERDITPVPAASTSKLFQAKDPEPLPPAVEAEQHISTSLEVTLHAYNLSWSEIRQHLKDNGLIADLYDLPTDCTAEEAHDIIRALGKIVANVKGGEG